jgi:GNAT superfamily N-acetyltransferase
MQSTECQVSLSAIDAERFGMQSARAVNVTVDNLQSVLDFCRDNNVKFLIARCNMTDIKAVQAMEGEGFFLTDTLVYYQWNPRFPSVASPTSQNVTVRAVKQEEEGAVQELAALSFQGYYGHYHADPRLDPAKCDETYASWAYRSCTSREVANEVLVAEMENGLVGFITLRINSSNEGEFVLGGVRPDAQGFGIYSLLFSAGKKWLLDQGVERIIVSTQLPNTTVQKVWTGQGFWLNHAFYTFHKWFD